MKLYKLFIKKTGSTLSKKCKIYPLTVITNSQVGDYTYISYKCWINNTTIGKYCSIAQDVKIGLGFHPTDYISSSPLFYSTKNATGFSFTNKNRFIDTKKVKIGNDVWIGTGAVILDGITIGDGSIIGANSVVTKDIEPYSIVGGVPAKIIRKRFSETIINQLLVLKWWDYSIDKLKVAEINKLFTHSVDESSIAQLLKKIKS